MVTEQPLRAGDPGPASQPVDRLDRQVLVGMASRARVRDHWLGGRDAYRADRQVAALLQQCAPWIPSVAKANLVFLHRAAAALARAGLGQFVHLDCGMPTTPSTDQIVTAVRPDAVVLYVDEDPVALAHSRALLARSQQSTVVASAALDVDIWLGRTAESPGIDVAEPVAVLAHDVLQHLDDQEVRRLAQALRARVAAGSVVAFTHLSRGATPQQDAEVHGIVQLYRELLAPLTMRTPAQLVGLLEGWQPLEHPLGPQEDQPTPSCEGLPLPVLVGGVHLPGGHLSVAGDAAWEPPPESEASTWTGKAADLGALNRREVG